MGFILSEKRAVVTLLDDLFSHFYLNKIDTPQEGASSVQINYHGVTKITTSSPHELYSKGMVLRKDSDLSDIK